MPVDTPLFFLLLHRQQTNIQEYQSSPVNI